MVNCCLSPVDYDKSPTLATCTAAKMEVFHKFIVCHPVRDFIQPRKHYIPVVTVSLFLNNQIFTVKKNLKNPKKAAMDTLVPPQRLNDA